MKLIKVKCRDSEYYKYLRNSAEAESLRPGLGKVINAIDKLFDNSYYANDDMLRVETTYTHELSEKIGRITHADYPVRVWISLKSGHIAKIDAHKAIRNKIQQMFTSVKIK